MAHADIHSGIHAGIHADTHVFGSTRGYGTVASSRGVRDEEARELESFQFGEASTADRIARLETRAVMTGRALRSGRFAISRMMPAGVDDAGRPTVEVVTLVVEARDYMACVGALPRLAADARLWLDARATAASGARIAAASAEPAPRDPQVLRLFDLWRAAVRHGAIGVVSETESDAVLRLVASLDPVDLLRCRWGIGLLSVSTPADICSVASGVSMHGARDVMRPAQQGAWHCGSESEYAGFRAAALPTLPSVADIELNGHTLVVAGDEGVVRASAVASPRPEARERRVMPFAIGSAVLSTAVLAVAVVMHGRRDEATPIVLGEAQELKARTDDSVKKRDALEAAIEKPEAPPLSAPPATPPSTPLATPPSAPPALPPSAPPAPAPSTPLATPPNTAPSPAAGTPPAAEPSTPPAAPQDATEEQSIAAFLELLNGAGYEKMSWPMSAPDPAALRRLQDTEKLRVFEFAKECVKHMRFIVGRDKERKKSAVDKERKGEERSDVVKANGFIIQKSIVGPGGDQKRNFLNLDLVEQWKSALEALRQRLPLDDRDAQLRDNWNSGLADGLGPNPEGADGVVASFLSIGIGGKTPDLSAEIAAANQVLKDHARRDAGGQGTNP